MPISLEQLAHEVDQGRITKLSLAQHSGLDWKTVQSALNGSRKTGRVTARVLLEAGEFLLAQIIPTDSHEPVEVPA